MYWTEKHEKVFDIKTKINGVTHNIGMIEKPYNSEEIYLVTGWNSETLSDNGSWIFRDFEKAKSRIITHYKNEMEVLGL